MADLRKNFLDLGPGVSSISLDEGVELLAEYKLKVAKLQRTKAELINAQNLFDLDVKPYPALQSTQSDLEQLDKIYSLYKEYKEFQESMSGTLWGDLDIAALQRGAEEMEKSAKRFPKDLKELATFKAVEARLVSFKESLPLVVNLKNDAMKIRHWQKLQEVTGVMFDVTLKTLTLSNIFAMDLGRFTTQVEEIINEAVQEGKIENELAKIDAAWRQNALVVVKYRKDGQDRGFMLRAAEDLKLVTYPINTPHHPYTPYQHPLLIHTHPIVPPTADSCYQHTMLVYPPSDIPLHNAHHQLPLFDTPY